MALMLMSLARFKSLANITGTDNDVQITFALEAVSALVSTYVGRRLVKDAYTESFVPIQTRYDLNGFNLFMLTEVPISSVTVPADITGETYLDGQTGILRARCVNVNSLITLAYEGGYDPIPSDIEGVVYQLTRLQLVSMGVNISGVSISAAPVKAVTIGSLKVDYAVNAIAGTTSGISPLTQDTLDDFKPILDLYMTHKQRLAT